MTRWTLLLLLTTAGLTARAAETPTTKPSAEWLNLARPLWADRLAKAGGVPIASYAYPSEESLVFLTAFSVTREPAFASQAAVQLDYCHGRATDGLIFTTDDLTSRDYQARQAYNFYLAYRILADGKYLRWADEAARALLRSFPRSAYECRGQTHELFAADLFGRDGKVARTNGERIDPNQNAEVALAFSLLYHDPASVFFRDPVAKSIAYEELLASMSIQDMTTGAISLTEHIAGADTAYGSYAAFSWTWCQLMWHEPKFEPHVRAAGRWLANLQNLQTDSDRYYPHVAKGPIPYWEANYRLPVYWYCGINAGPFIAALRDRSAHPEATPGDLSFAPLYWAYFDLIGMPRDAYLDGTR